MKRTLGDLVHSALSDADSQLKIASRQGGSASSDSSDFLDRELSTSLAQPAAKQASADKTPAPAAKKASREIISDAAYGIKLAEALEMGAAIVSKIAHGPVDAPGPAVSESGFQDAKTQSPKATSNVTDKITGPATDASTLPTTIADHTGKTAADTALANAKKAQAEVLARMGKTAADPSSPQAKLPAHSESFKISTEPGESRFVPDNKGLIDMTRAQAKDRTVAQAREHISERPKKDNAVAAHTLRTDGQKISSVDPNLARAYLEKAASVAADPTADPKERVKAASILRTVKDKIAERQEGALGLPFEGSEKAAVSESWVRKLTLRGAQKRWPTHAQRWKADDYTRGVERHNADLRSYRHDLATKAERAGVSDSKGVSDALRASFKQTKNRDAQERTLQQHAHSLRDVEREVLNSVTKPERRLR